ncbi:MAG: ribosome silencing factor [Pseudohongiellaceae bacterium]
MKSQALKDLVVAALDDMKGRDIACLEVANITSITDYMVVATGTSSRHVNSLADEVQKKVKEAGGHVLGSEGKGQSEWVLIDLGDVIVHVMQEESRKLYDLESLWGMTPGKAV